MKENLCPKCFERNTREVYACQNHKCGQEGKPQPAPENLAEGESPVCGECGAPLTQQLCAHCGHPLDREQSENPLLPLSIIGAHTSGKSNFLSVLIDRLGSDFAKLYGCSLYPFGGDATMEVYDREYHNPLFVQGRCPASTEQEDIEPLKYSLVFPAGSENGRTCNVTFHDACGSNFDSEKTMTVYNRSIYNSRGIFLLVDPTQLPGVREKFKLEARPVLDSDPGPLLSRTIHLIRAGVGIKNMQQKIDIPIAVCLTKMDTIKHLLDPSSFVAGPSRHMRQPHLDRIDRTACDLEVRSLMESWNGRDLVNQITAQFSRCSFFALSALGTQPTAQGEVSRILPHRVLDPLLWLLWQNEIIGCQ